MIPAPTQSKVKFGLPPDADHGVTGALLIEPASTTPLGPRILSADEAACRLSGYSRQSLLGSPIGLIYDNRDLPKLLARLPRIAETSEPFWMDRTLIKARGHRQRARWTIRAHRTGDGGLVGYFLTVGDAPPATGVPLSFDEKPSAELVKELTRPGPSRVENVSRSFMPGRLGRELESAPAPAEKAEERSSPMSGSRRGLGGGDSALANSLAMAAGGVAHDIKNNLHSIKANLHLAHLAAPEETVLVAHLSDAKMALEYAEVLARRMLAFTRGETRELCDFDVEGILNRVAMICTAGSKVRCRYHISPNRRQVYGDRQEISQVFHNLLTNACDAMPKGGVIDISAASRRWDSVPEGLDLKPGVYTVVSIRDRGCGIPDEHLPQIFDMRFTTKLGGSGFGLASCLETVKRHGGTITVHSKQGVGTEFLVFLPASEAEVPVDESRPAASSPAQASWTTSPPIPCERPAPTSPASTASTGALGRSNGSERDPAEAGYRILLVEDQLFVAKATSGMLKHLGHRVSVAENGKEALRLHQQAKFSDEPFDLVLMDMTLPGGLNGGEVFERMRRIDPGLRVVATSGYFDEDDTSVLGNHEYTGILAKPFSLEALEIVIRAAFNELA